MARQFCSDFLGARFASIGNSRASSDFKAILDDAGSLSESDIRAAGFGERSWDQFQDDKALSGYLGRSVYAKAAASVVDQCEEAVG